MSVSVGGVQAIFMRPTCQKNTVYHSVTTDCIERRHSVHRKDSISGPVPLPPAIVAAPLTARVAVGSRTYSIATGFHRAFSSRFFFLRLFVSPNGVLGLHMCNNTRGRNVRGVYVCYTLAEKKKVYDYFFQSRVLSDIVFSYTFSDNWAQNTVAELLTYVIVVVQLFFLV